MKKRKRDVSMYVRVHAYACMRALCVSVRVSMCTSVVLVCGSCCIRSLCQGFAEVAAALSLAKKAYA